MKIYYRISQNSYPKDRLSYAGKENCFLNFLKHFPVEDITVVADNVDSALLTFLQKYTLNIVEISEGHGALSFNRTLDLTLELQDQELVYFVEDDYLHRTGALEVIKDGLSDNFSFDYLTLYDHPDKYLNPFEGGNPLCSGRSEETRVYLGKYCHFKQTNSTTMTFASKVKTLREDIQVLRNWTNQLHPPHRPYDMEMFLELRKKGRVLVSSIPGFSTHGEVNYLSPLINWEDEV